MIFAITGTRGHNNAEESPVDNAIGTDSAVESSRGAASSTWTTGRLASSEISSIQITAGNELHRQLRLPPLHQPPPVELRVKVSHEADTAQQRHSLQQQRYIRRSTQHQQSTQQQQRGSLQSVHLSRSNTACLQLTASEVCVLCDRCLWDASGRGAGVVDPADADAGSDYEDSDESYAAAARWRRMPCDCPERYLHDGCLESGFLEDSVYRAGERQLLIGCKVCRVSLLVRRQRGRRTCDRQAWLAFGRHLTCAGVVAGLLISFGVWSLLTEEVGPTVINVGLVSLGCLSLLVFACLEVKFLHDRFEFTFTRLGAGGNEGDSSRDPTIKEERNVGTVNRAMEPAAA